MKYWYYVANIYINNRHDVYSGSFASCGKYFPQKELEEELLKVYKNSDSVLITFAIRISEESHLAKFD